MHPREMDVLRKMFPNAIPIAHITRLVINDNIALRNNDFLKRRNKIQYVKLVFNQAVI